MLELYRSEFKTLQSDLLNISIDLQQPMRFDLIVYHTYYDFFICKKIPPGVKDIERIEQDYKYWVHSFLKNYGKENKSLLYSEILKLDIAKLEQVKPFWNGNLEDYISYPNFNKLIDCLKKIKYFHVFYESYNRMLDTTHVNPIETKEHANQPSDFYNIPNYQLISNLTISQLGELFDLLKGEFIPESTDRESFFWAFGDKKQPEQWQLIKWNEAKQGLRELLTPILGTITNQHIRNIKNLFLDRESNPFKMNKSTFSKDEVSARYGDICKIIENLNLD